MGRILFATPDVHRFHLHDRLTRRLAEAGFEVHVVHSDPVAHAVWQAQEQPSTLVEPVATAAERAPVHEFAALERRRLGLQPDAQRGLVARIARLAPAFARAMDRLAPDLVFVVGARTAERRLCHFLARERGAQVLWGAEGLLPHTMQVDPMGVDGEAQSTRWHALDHRHHRADANLIAGGLAHLLARDHPLGVARRIVRPPTTLGRLALGVRSLLRLDLAGCRRARNGWQEALRPARTAAPAWELPTHPFVAVLLQDPTDERVRLDDADPPTHAQLIGATVAAARALDAALHVVVVAPPAGLDADVTRACAALPNVTVAPPQAAAEAAATALATTTCNHPLAVAALLAGGPLLHTGRALYGLSPVTWRGPTGEFEQALRAGLAADPHEHLRQRFLTWLLDAGHVWCSDCEPSFNGLLGLGQTLQVHASRGWPKGLGLRYRRGPAWPLTYGRSDG